MQDAERAQLHHTAGQRPEHQPRRGERQPNGGREDEGRQRQPGQVLRHPTQERVLRQFVAHHRVVVLGGLVVGGRQLGVLSRQLQRSERLEELQIGGVAFVVGHRDAGARGERVQHQHQSADRDPVPQLRIQRAVAHVREVAGAPPVHVAMQRLEPLPFGRPVRGVTPDRQERRKPAPHTAVGEVGFESAGPVDGGGHRHQRHLVERGGPEEPAEDAAGVLAELLDDFRPDVARDLL